MKNLNYFIVILFVCILNVSYAQKKISSDMQDKFIMAQFNEVKQSLQLTEEKANELKPLYIEFLQEMRPEKPNMNRKKETLTDDEITEILENKLANAKNMALTREKYYYLFKKILTPRQIMTMYDTEREIMRKVTMEIRTRAGKNFEEKH